MKKLILIIILNSIATSGAIASYEPDFSSRLPSRNHVPSSDLNQGLDSISSEVKRNELRKAQEDIQFTKKYLPYIEYTKVIAIGAGVYLFSISQNLEIVGNSKSVVFLSSMGLITCGGICSFIAQHMKNQRYMGLHKLQLSQLMDSEA